MIWLALSNIDLELDYASGAGPAPWSWQGCLAIALVNVAFWGGIYCLVKAMSGDRKKK